MDREIPPIGRQLKRPGFELDESASAALLAHSWRGNVRELANVLERAAILADGTTISASLLGLGMAAPAAQPTGVAGFEGTLKELEREAIKAALAATGGHRKKTAERLGIGLRTLYEKLKEYELG